MKKILPVLCSLAMISVMSAVPTSAASYFSHSTTKQYYVDEATANYTENGCPWEFIPNIWGKCSYQSLNWLRYNRFLVVTTAEGLPADCTDEEYPEIIEWDAYVQEVTNGSEIPSGALLDNMNQLKKDYGTDVKLYVVYLANDDVPYTAARQFMKKYEAVQAAFMLEQQEQGNCRWNGKYQVRLSRDETNKLLEIGGANQLSDEELLTSYPELFSEDSILNVSKSSYDEWISVYAPWIAQYGSDFLDTKEGAEQLLKDQIATPYDVMTKARNAANTFYETYTSKYVACYPGFERENSIAVYHAFSPWDNIGDLDEDDEITASDAAEILIAVANGGAGESDGLSVEAQQFADVNADGVVDASDAATILQYASAFGSGQNVAITDFTK